MDGWMYYGSLAVIAMFIFSMTRTNNNFLALIAFVVGAYIVYSHETGYTATDFRYDMVNKIDQETGDYDYSENKNREEAKKLVDEN